MPPYPKNGSGTITFFVIVQSNSREFFFIIISLIQESFCLGSVHFWYLLYKLTGSLFHKKQKFPPLAKELAPKKKKQKKLDEFEDWVVICLHIET